MSLELQTFGTVDEAGRAVQSGATYLGGGTLVVRRANEGDLSLTGLVRSTDPVLSRITVEGGRVILGASVTMAEIAAHPDLAAIALAAKAVGGPAVRNMATVGGNLFAPAPYGDFATALLALNATVTTTDGETPLDDFLNTRDGIVTSVSFDLPTGAFRFRKVSRVRPKGVSVLSIAAVLTTGNGKVTTATIALGAMAARPVRARAAEAALTGAELTETGIAPAVAKIHDGTDPATDAIASSWYRAEVLPVHFRRLLLD